MNSNLPKNMDDIITAFNEWYENDDHSKNEDLYQDKITEENLSNLKDDEFITFFEGFLKEGGSIMSGGPRNATKVINYIKESNNLKDFREKILLPFQEDFDVDKWLKWAEGLKIGFGKGSSTIYLNRVNKKKYCVVNKKSIEAYQKLGYEIKTTPLITCYNNLAHAEDDLIKRYSVLNNFYKADSLTHFLISTDIGKSMLPNQYFTEKQIETFQQYVGKEWNKESTEHIQAKDIIVDAAKLVKVWATEIRNKAFPYGPEPKKKLNCLDQATPKKFRPYLFQTLVPSNSSPDIINYWITLGSKGIPPENIISFNVSLGFPHDLNKKQLSQYPNFRKRVSKLKEIYGGDDEFDKKFQSSLPATKALELSMDELSDWAIDQINGFPRSYDELCEDLGLTAQHQVKYPKIWKISHGNDQTGVNQDKHDLLLKKGYVAIGFFDKPEHRQRQKFEAIKPNDYFYLVRNAQIILLGQLEDLPPLEIEGITDRFCRKFKPLTSLNIIPEEANLTKRVIGYKMDEPFNSSDIDCSDELRGLGFMPSGQTTVFEVGEAYLEDFESSVLKPVFNLSLENLFITSASEQILDNAENSKGNEMQQAFNQILYGPPGTGKTYNTVNKAIKIANPSTEENTTREQIKTEFDELIRLGQVVFTTFHQSMSYEDFIEGIKPLKPENGDTFVKYKIQDGIFKQICDNAKSNSNKNFVLIIDEINRGNVSQIFGELITLIEDDKRLGCPEALKVTLPYSKEEFGVPSNLYIIGTMNTADRSVEALDAALRRRFSFEEMQPDSNLIKNKGKLKDGLLKLADDEINLPNLLKVINLRIEKLLDKDHQIGHSYFINVKKLDELKLAFQNKIIPLLQEYFFGDYGKIGLVLGKGFVEKVQNKSFFADFPDADANDFSERPIFTIKTPTSNNEFVVAIKSLLNP